MEGEGGGSVSDGSAVLGLGNISYGGDAGMEGLALLFK